MASLTLSIIAKNEVEKVKAIIDKYSQYFERIDVAVDERVDEFNLLKSDKVNIYPYKWQNDFSHKRNFLKEQCKTDYFFRIDTDDEIVNPENIAPLMKKLDKEMASVVSCFYDYAKDEWGNTTAAHYRETIIENSNNLYWNKSIHETILPRDERYFSIIADDTIKINHLIDKKHSDESLQRNIKFLIDEYNQDRENADPRTLAYLGRSFMGLGEFKTAIKFLEKHIEKSGWNEDRYLSWCQLSHIYRVLGLIDRSIACAFEAIQELPNYPDAYFELHDTYFNQEKWQKAIEWAVTGFSKPIPKTNMLIDPSAYTWRPMLSLAACYYQTGDFDRAYQLLKKAKVYVPTMQYILDTEKTYETAYYHQKYIDKFLWLLAFTKDKDSKKAIDLVKSVPDELQEHDAVCKAKNTFLPPKVWGKDEITLYCGHTWEKFTPKTVETGIGGSEEAVIHLSRELAKLGYKVTVYNDCGDGEGDYDGVKYLNTIRFNPKDAFNIFISWRCNIFSYGVEARRKIIWVHDLPLNLNLYYDKLSEFDKIVVLSQYHASLLPDFLPKEKVYISTNGLVPEDFEVIKGIQRNPHRIIYASSYNRGLEELLSMFSEVKKEVSDAEIHAYYGWDTYDRAVATGDVKDDGFKARMLELMKQPGVFEHGRIGHKELLKEYAKAGVFAYPGKYTGEINCIALTKAIACGCVCVTNDFAVLKERNPDYVVSNEEFCNALIQALKESKEVRKDIHKYIQDNSWEAVAKDWDKNLFPLEIPTEVVWREDFVKDKLTPEIKIIDIGGAGGGVLSEDDYPNLISVDIDNYPKMKRFVQANAEALPFKDKSFDVAVMGEVLEHVENPQKALSEAIRVANYLIITVPEEHEWTNPYAVPFNTIEKEEKMLGKKVSEIYKDTPDHIFYKDDNYKHLKHQRFYSYDTLKKELENAGLKKFKITKLRKAGVTHLGVTVNADIVD